jgi:cytochrome c peroxidase
MSTVHHPKFSSRAAAGLLFAVFLYGCSPQQENTVIVLDAPAAEPHAASAATARFEKVEFANEELSPRVMRRFAALTEEKLAASELVDLGRMLYFDTRLSKTGEVSCNSCHPLDQYGATHDAVSRGIGGRMGKRNAPSTYHAAGQFAQFWDGRAATVELQATVPIEDANEMGMNGPEIVAKLNRIDGYREAFRRAFPTEAQPVSLERVGVALGAFERGLVTPSRWDRYVRGDVQALNAQEKAGAKLFANLGCIVCHTGPYLGGSMFERLGARVPWPNRKDSGRKQVTGNAADDMMFKVPSLRNVAKTAPYFHDGSAATLDQAVRMMARHQLGVELDNEEAAELEAWLGSLTGDLPRDYIAPPALPAGT